jgi:hypothetical protein
MKTFSFFFSAILLLTVLPDAQAQSTDDWWDWAARSDRTSDRYDDRYDDDRYDDWDDDDWDEDEWDDDRYDRRDRRYDRRDNRGRRARGPKFCQNGQGHPTKGMRWCYEKGFATRGYDRRDRRRTPRWERRSIEDIIFRAPRRDRRVERRRAERRIILEDVLGRTRLRQLQRVADGPLAARWVYPSRTVRVLQVRDRRGPLIEMTDLNGDGRVDVFLANSLR